MGADNPKLISYPQEKIMGFRGLNTTASAPLIEDSRASSLLNVKLSSAFDLKKRAGADTINNISLDDLDQNNPSIQGIFDSVYSNGNSWTYAFIGNKLKYDNAGTWTNVNSLSGTLTAGQNNQFQCIMALDNAICTNDVDVVLKISSTPTRSSLDVSDLSDTLTKVKTLVFYRNYLIFGNTVENSIERPTRFRWSLVGDIENYDNDDFVDIATFAGDELIGFAELYGDLYIFLTKSIWRASLTGGDDVFTFLKVVDGIGAIARDSISVIQFSSNRSAVVFFDDRRKVLLFDGAVVTDIGRIIQPTLDTLSPSRLQYAVSTFDGQSYYLSATSSGGSTNDTLFEYQTEINEWTKHDQLDANSIAQVKEATSLIKTYFGNYGGFVYWMDNPDNYNDVEGFTGIIDSVGASNTAVMTGAQAIIDAGITFQAYTGAIVKITSGAGSGQERIISTAFDTGFTVNTAFSTDPDSTSVYSIGAIEAQYTTKWYDIGNPNREKSFIGLLFWAEEASSNEVTISHAIDFGSSLGSTTKSLAPSSSSLWDSALWDTGTWGTTGDKLYTVKTAGFGNFVEYEFENDEIDESFHLYGFNILGISGDIKQ